LNWQPEIVYPPVVFALAFIVTLLIRNKILDMIISGGFVRPNFKGENIPLAAGVVFFITTVTVTMPLFLFWPEYMRNQALVFLFAVAGATCLGLVDDFWGARDASGLLGHFKALFNGRVTTGAVKAIGGGILALVAGAQLYPGNYVKIIDSSLIIALSANLINLFDLRPGRAGKMYILLYLILLPAVWGRPEGVMATMVLGGLVAFLPVDLKARAMMGDAGSNTLGMVAGITAAASLQGYSRFIFLGALILIHIITERYSLTRIIAGNTLLNYLDMLGRGKE
jgi:UDP-N-acetylmuramyl pentapeptide phosphotransferase/UDP-N-acetylglucosamine-1-phosphate transferase